MGELVLTSVGVISNFLSSPWYRQWSHDICKDAGIERNVCGNVCERFCKGRTLDVFRFKNGAERDFSYFPAWPLHRKKIFLLKPNEFTCCRRQDIKTRQKSSNAIFSQSVYYSLLFGFANNYLTSVALWRKKRFVKVPVLHSSTYHFDLKKHSPEKKTRSIKLNVDIFEVKKQQIQKQITTNQ